MTDYTPISFDMLPQYLRLLNLNPSQASDYTFANLWGWAQHYGLEWRFADHLCWIRQTRQDVCHWGPVGPWESVTNWGDFPEMAAGAHFVRVPERLCALWQERLPEAIRQEESRGQWDYIYLSAELASLSGPAFHKKKNLLNQFVKKNVYTYKTLEECDVDTVLALQNDWCRWRDCEESSALIAENEAVERVLSRFSDIPGLCGGLILVDDKPMAYTLAEPLHKDTLVIHFEKACNCFKGSYQAINYLFSNDIGKNYPYINREQDLGEEGLRKAKESYNPTGFAKKCEVFVE